MNLSTLSANDFEEIFSQIISGKLMNQLLNFNQLNKKNLPQMLFDLLLYRPKKTNRNY